MPPNVFALIHSRARPAPLDGTEAQRKYARSIRDGFLRDFGLLGRKDLVALARCVVDATWFIANKGRSPDGLCWPSEDQMEPAVPSGPCPNCGEPAYGNQVCSDECAEEFSAYLARDAAGRSAEWIDL